MGSRQAGSRSWSCSWEILRRAALGGDSLTRTGTRSFQGETAQREAASVRFPLPKDCGAAGEPPTHPRTHMRTLAPAVVAGDVLFYLLLRTPFIHFSSHFIGPASKQPAQSERTLLEPACMDHGQHRDHQRTCAVCTGCILPNFSARSDRFGRGRPCLRMNVGLCSPFSRNTRWKSPGPSRSSCPGAHASVDKKGQ